MILIEIYIVWLRMLGKQKMRRGWFWQRIWIRLKQNQKEIWRDLQRSLQWQQFSLLADTIFYWARKEVFWQRHIIRTTAELGNIRSEKHWKNIMILLPRTADFYFRKVGRIWRCSMQEESTQNLYSKMLIGHRIRKQERYGFKFIREDENFQYDVWILREFRTWTGIEHMRNSHSV